MRRPLVIVSVAIGSALSVAQTSTKAAVPPTSAQEYRLSFERGEAIPGVVASRAISAASDCTSDGTVFLNMVLQPSPEIPPTDQLVSVSLSRESHEFRLDQLTDLYDLQQKAHFVSEMGVAFLVVAAPENKQGKESFVDSQGTSHEVVHNVAERHDYLVLFDRTGSYKKKVRLDESLAIQRIAVYPSGTILAFGFDVRDRSPKLALFGNDGTFVRFLEIPTGSAPKSMFGTKDDSGDGPAIYARPSQLVRHGDFIIVVQNGSAFPLLEVSQTGAIRKLEPKLPKDVRIEALIPSDQLLYARVTDPRFPIYELNPEDGTVSRRFHIGANQSADAIACVHEGKFLSFDHGDGKLIPLVGNVLPTNTAATPAGKQ